MTTLPPPLRTTLPLPPPRAADGLTITVIGGPTALIEVAGLRLLIDPTFDPPGSYAVGSRTLTKTSAPALDVDAVGPIDVVLLSHDQHPDNLDRSGRTVLSRAGLVLTTQSAADRLGGRARALAPWSSVDLTAPGCGQVQVTGVTAQHGPDGTEHLTGEVVGFVLSGDQLPTVYISGDNASLDVVHDVDAHCGPIDIALLFAGAAMTPLIPNAHLTLTSAMAATATEILDRPHVLPLHTDGWDHFSEDGATLRAAFKAAGLGHLLLPSHPGAVVRL
jgi:L-ascorbate metabolism protein UlaG (beta-lactamase superfamily)